MSNRRNFLKYSGLAAGSLLLPAPMPAAKGCPSVFKKSGKSTRMKLRFRPYELQLRHVFTIANNSRTTTPVMLTEVEFDEIIGYGEASMPPYLGESHKSAAEFLSKVDISTEKIEVISQQTKKTCLRYATLTEFCFEVCASVRSI